MCVLVRFTGQAAMDTWGFFLPALARPTAKSRPKHKPKPVKKIARITKAPAAAAVKPRQAAKRLEGAARKQDAGGKAFRLATVCSGMECPAMALEALGANFASAACCEANVACQNIIQQNFKTDALFEDVCDVNLKGKFPDHDVLVAGPPCQPFSKAGAGRGMDDDRSGPFVSTLELIQAKAPKAYLLENVLGLRGGKHKNFFRLIIKSLKLMEAKGKKYKVFFRTLNTIDFQVPQSRPRVFIVGLREDVVTSGFVWPVPSKTPAANLAQFLDPKTLAENHKRRPKASQTTACKNVSKAIAVIKAAGLDPAKDEHIADVDSTNVQIRRNACPCLTASRMRCGGHWVVSRGRRLKLSEAMRLQGIKPERIAFKGVVSRAQIGGMVGNGMSVNVLQAVLARMSHAAPKAFNGQIFRDKWSATLN